MVTSAQFRSLPVQAALTAGLFLGCCVLGGLIVSQRGRFESFVKENYAPSRKELSASTKEVTLTLLRSESARDEWGQVPESERRTVYIALMQHDEFPMESLVRACVDTDLDFFVMCAERTSVCGNLEQKARALKFLELSDCELGERALSRLADWATRANRADIFELAVEARKRMLGRSR